MVYTGLKKQPEDKRDHSFDHIAGYVDDVDWEEGFDIEEYLGGRIISKNQGSSDSCVAHSVAYYAYVLNIAEIKKITEYGLDELRVKYQKSIPELSAKSIFSQIFLNYGAYNRDGVKKLINYGINTESEVPTKPERGLPTKTFVRDLSWKNEDLEKKASNYKGKEYRLIRTGSDMDIFAKAIRDNLGVVSGVVGSNNRTWRTEEPKPPKNGDKLWRHSMYFGKYGTDEKGKFISCKNSWGDKTGNKGWQKLREDYFRSGNVFDAWTVMDKPNGGWFWLIDRDGKPRKMPAYFHKTIKYLLTKRGFKLK